MGLCFGRKCVILKFKKKFKINLINALKILNLNVTIKKGISQNIRSSNSVSMWVAWTVWAAIAQSINRMATGWTGQGSNTGVGVIFRTFADRHWGSPIHLYNGYRVFGGGKRRPGCEADPSPTSSGVVMKGWSYTSPLWAVSPVQKLSDCTRMQFTFF